MDIRLDGRGAVITGGSLGLGRAIATRFADSGAKVVIAGRGADSLEAAKAAIKEATGQDATTVQADVSTAEGCAHLIDAAEAALGQVDILVNNAGTSARGPFLEVDDAAWQTDLDLKLFAHVRLCRRVLPAMAERKWGRIINVLNIGSKAPQAEGAPTAVSRAAGLALTKLLASEFAPHNVLVNAMLVGKIRSNQWEKRHAKAGDNRSLDEYYGDIGNGIPLGRYGYSEEFADLACFLASENAGYVTGTGINVDGGLSPVV